MIMRRITHTRPMSHYDRQVFAQAERDRLAEQAKLVAAAPQTPLPYRVEADGLRILQEGYAVGYVQVADCSNKHIPPGVAQANAKFLVRAANAHEQLVAALRAMTKACAGGVGMAPRKFNDDHPAQKNALALIKQLEEMP